MKIKVNLFMLFLILILFSQLIFPHDKSCNIELRSDGNDSKIDDENVKRLIEEIEKVKFDSFVYMQAINTQYKRSCSQLYEVYFDKKFENIHKIYPSILFFRMIRYIALYKNLKFETETLGSLKNIYDDTLDINYSTEEQFEKIDTLMLLAAKHPQITDSLSKDALERLAFLSIYSMNNVSQHVFHFGKYFSSNNHSKITPVVFNFLMNKETDTIKSLEDKYKIDESVFWISFVDYLMDNYNSNFYQLYKQLYEQCKKDNNSQAAKYYISTLKNHISFSVKFDSFFDDYFDSELYRIDKDCISKDSLYPYVLTFDRLKIIRRKFTESIIKKNEVLLRRILAYVWCDNFRDCETYINDDFDESSLPNEFMCYSLTMDSFNEIYDTEYTFYITDINNVIIEIENSFKEFDKSAFIEYKSGLVITDHLYNFENTVGKRQFDKWSYGELGYASPTYPTSCFKEWENHKKEFPKYDALRKQYLSYRKKFKK